MNWLDGGIKNFMSLKKPDVGFGFFSNEYSENESDFIEGLEGGFEGVYTGLMGRVASEKTHAFTSAVSKLLEEQAELMLTDEEFESYFSLWKMGEYNFFILAEIGTNDKVCSKLKKLVKDSSLFEEASTHREELSMLPVPQHFKEDLLALQKEENEE